VKIKIGSILVLILALALAWWGFFYLKIPQKALLYENKSLEVPLKEDKEPKEKLSVVEVENNIQKPVAESEVIENENSDGISVEEEIKPEIKKDLKNSLAIKDKLVSWGFDYSNGRKIDTVILHSSYNALGGDKYSLEKLILEYKEYGVAPHYVIDRKGEIFRLVKDENIAYHAGESRMPDGRTGVNNFSIGVELMNIEEDEFTSEQYVAVNDLIAYLENKYEISYILGHNQIAPKRKTDPWNINWGKINK
jgi:hypothetical protein